MFAACAGHRIREGQERVLVRLRANRTTRFLPVRLMPRALAPRHCWTAKADIAASLRISSVVCPRGEMRADALPLPIFPRP